MSNRKTNKKTSKKIGIIVGIFDDEWLIINYILN